MNVYGNALKVAKREANTKVPSVVPLFGIQGS